MEVIYLAQHETNEFDCIAFEDEKDAIKFCTEENTEYGWLIIPFRSKE
jgi:hypothetical protein